MSEAIAAIQKDVLQSYNNLRFEDLPLDMQKAVFARAKFNDFVQQVQKAAAVDRVDWQDTKTRWLKSLTSKHTLRSYTSALERYEAWCNDSGITPQALTVKQARAYVSSLEAQGYSPASIRLFVAAVQKLFTYIEGEDEDAKMRNPFNFVKLPRKKPVHKCIYPTREEAGRIISYFKAHEKTGKLAQIASLMAFDGFRIGAFESMDISDKGTARGVSKGKEYEKKLSKESIEALDGLQGKAFSEWTATRIADLFQKHIGAMYKAGLLREKFSPHDLRHYYATELYKATKDVRKVQIALGHSNIAVTDTYLRAYGLIKD